jgi:hypothetical protein
LSICFSTLENFTEINHTKHIICGVFDQVSATDIDLIEFLGESYHWKIAGLSNVRPQFISGSPTTELYNEACVYLNCCRKARNFQVNLRSNSLHDGGYCISKSLTAFTVFLSPLIATVVDFGSSDDI